MKFPELPILSSLPEIRESLAHNCGSVLTAPPGSGKTTIVPLSLLDEPWLKGKRILMLEPRRLATRMAANRMKSILGPEREDEVGYHVRMEKRYTSKSRIIVLTEGLLTRRLLSDPELSDVGLIIFDEFHERSINADIGFALSLDVQKSLRNDLRILVMSATLDAQHISNHMRKVMNGANVPVVEAFGSCFDVQTRYVGRNLNEEFSFATSSVVCKALRENNGSILVFLPGEREILNTAKRLEELKIQADIFPLYSSLPYEEQERAIQPSEGRKVVLATSIAESSVTIEGITVVIDSGLIRARGFSPDRGLSRQETRKITKDRADQRRGRAGRLTNGVCYRMWSEYDILEPHAKPEILDSDLTTTVLQCAEWGAIETNSLDWLDEPSQQLWLYGVTLLKNIGALDKNGGITKHGRDILSFGVHPRLAHAIIRVGELLGSKCAMEMCTLAAVISECDGVALKEIDLNALYMQVLSSVYGRGLKYRVERLAKAWQSVYSATCHGVDSATSVGVECSFGVFAALAYPERIARKRKRDGSDRGKFLLSIGRGCKVNDGVALANEEWLVILDTDDKQEDALVRRAVALSYKEFAFLYEDKFEKKVIVEWDEQKERVKSEEILLYGSIIVKTLGAANCSEEDVVRCLCDGLRRNGLRCLNRSREANSLRERVSFLSRVMPEMSLPSMEEEDLLRDLELWLGEFLYGKTSLGELASIDMYMVLKHYVGYGMLAEIDREAPTHLRVPSGSAIRIDYSEQEPFVAVKLQEIFGLKETPRIAGGKVQLTMKILSPAMRPVQVTKDLTSFWEVGYKLVVKELRGRYPKHYWPENPYEAKATRFVRPK